MIQDLGPGDFGKPEWGWSIWRHRLFKYGFPPFAVALIAGAGWFLVWFWGWFWGWIMK